MGAHADVAQLVEHHLAKVGVAGSNPVVRSKQCKCLRRAGVSAPGLRSAPVVLSLGQKGQTSAVRRVAPTVAQCHITATNHGRALATVRPMKRKALVIALAIAGFVLVLLATLVIALGPTGID
jgi:hypothetical protein